MKKYLLTASVLLGILFAQVANAQFLTVQGGTGTTTPSGILSGDNGATGHLNTVKIGAGCTFSANTLACPGTGASFSYPFTPTSYGASTTTVLGFLNGLVSNGSTTISGLSSGLVGNNNGLLYSLASSSLFGFIPSSFPFTPFTGYNGTSTAIGFTGGAFINGSTTISSLGSGFVGANNGLLYGFASSTLSSLNFWQFANGLFNTVVLESSSTPIYVPSTGTSTIANLGGVLDASAFAGSDMGAQIDSAYAALPTIGGTIHVPAGKYSISTEIAFNTNNKHVNLQCDPGGATQITWTPTTGTSTVINTGQNLHGQQSSVDNCIFIGPTPGIAGSGTTTLAVAVEIGGPNGARGFSMNNVEISNFGKFGAVVTGKNSYMLSFSNDQVLQNGKAFYDMYSSNGTANANAGEGMNWYNGMWGDCNSLTACFDTNNGGEEYVFNGTGFDNGQVYISANVVQATFIGDNIESSAGSAGVPYVPIVIANSSNTNVSMNGVAFVSGADVGNCPAQIIQNGAQLTIQGSLATEYNGCVVADFITNTGNGWFRNYGLFPQGTQPYTTLVNSTGGTGTTQFDIENNGSIGIGGQPNDGKFELTQTTNSSAGGETIFNSVFNGTTRLWEDGNAVSRLDGGFNGTGLVSINGAVTGTGNVGIGVIPVPAGQTGGDTLQVQSSFMVGSSSVNGLIEQRNTGGVFWTSKFIGATNGLTMGDNAGSAQILNFANPLGYSVNVALGSSTPYAKLSVQANNGDTNTILFAIGSSTANATTTLFSVGNTGSTTIGNFGSCSGGNALTTNSSGTIVCGALSGFDTFAYPFLNQATSTTLAFTGGLTASSSVLFQNINGSPLSWSSATGNFGLGTTTPFAQLSVLATSTTGINSPLKLFAIASTTGGTSTSTLFAVSNTGTVTSGAISMNGFGQGFATPYIQDGNTPPAFYYLDTSNHAIRMGAQDSASTWLPNIVFELPKAGGGYVDALGLATTTGLLPGGSVDNILALGATGQRWKSLFIGTGGGEIQASTTIGGGSNITGLTISGGATTTGNAYFASNVGIGTSSPSAQFVSVAASTTVGTVANNYQGIVAIIAGLENTTTKLFQEIDQWGHRRTSGDAPTVTGGTSSVSGNDDNGNITVTGTALTSVTLTFAHPWINAPDCTVSDNTTASVADITSVSTTQVVFGLSVGINSGTLWYQCVEHF